MALSERERAIRLRLKADLEHYAMACLKIRTKAGTIEPLILTECSAIALSARQDR
jgi:hypothetical protein